MRRRLLLVLTALIAGAGAAPAMAGPSIQRLGFTDHSLASVPSSEQRALVLAEARRARGSLIRLTVPWYGVERSPAPSRETARSPSFAGYDWAAVDENLRTVTAAGHSPIVLFGGAPTWSEGPGRPSGDAGGNPGSWMPSPDALRDFSEALARRYSGSTPDPAVPGANLPRVRYWQVWNEPNLTLYLAPQWRDGQPFAPGHYRRLLNAAASGLRAADRRNVVITGGTAPYGDFGQGRRIMPARFWREVFCLDDSLRRSGSCNGAPVQFDVFAHHPYSVSPPLTPAGNADDVQIPDLGKLVRILSAARRGRVIAGRKPLWVTEYGFDTSPPDPAGIPERLAAEYVSQALHQFWLAGSTAVLWLQVRDEPEGEGYASTLQSGLFFRGASVGEDRPKLSYRAFRFPFVAYGRRQARVWGRAPGRGRVRIQVRRGRRWRTLRVLRTTRGGIFSGRVRARRRQLVRARLGRREYSLAFRVR